MKRIISLLLSIPLLLNAQVDSAVQGIQFIKGLRWQQILAKAKAENKYVFVDCYTTWCGPCKYMSQDIFPLSEVGDFFNQHFVNIAIQMDHTDKDSSEVMNWYGDAANIEKLYKIK